MSSIYYKIPNKHAETYDNIPAYQVVQQYILTPLIDATCSFVPNQRSVSIVHFPA